MATRLAERHARLILRVLAVWMLVVHAGCSRERPVFARARAAFGYDDASKGLILGFKHADRLHGAPAFARWLARAGGEMLETADLICPVPLHWTRLAWRRFNQSAVLAREVAKLTGKPYVGDLLVRRRRTPQQGELGVDERRRNVRAAGFGDLAGVHLPRQVRIAGAFDGEAAGMLPLPAKASNTRSPGFDHCRTSGSSTENGLWLGWLPHRRASPSSS